MSCTIHERLTAVAGLVTIIMAIATCMPREASAATSALDAKVISEASGATTTTALDGTVRISGSRTDVTVAVDGMPLPPPAGLGSWAAFAPMANGAMVMGDTVVFEDEVEAVLDAAFANGLGVTASLAH